MNRFRRSSSAWLSAFQNRKPHAAAVRQPASEQNLDELFHAFDQLDIGPTPGGLPVRMAPVGGRNDKTLRDGRAADLEHGSNSVMAPGPTGCRAPSAGPFRAIDTPRLNSPSRGKSSNNRWNDWQPAA